MSLLLEAGAEDDLAAVTPMAQQRHQVESRLAANRVSPRRYRFSIWRSRLANAMAAAVLMVLFVTLAPVRHNHTIGYNLELAGVSQDLAENDEQLCNLLYDLGLFEADISLLGCDSTCGLMVMDLKTRDEAQRVVRAVQRLANSSLEANLIPVEATSSRTLLQRANETILRHLN